MVKTVEKIKSVQQVSQKKPRESNIELYRIILMLFIICHHYVVNSGLKWTMYQNPLDIKSIILFILGAWGKIGNIPFIHIVMNYITWYFVIYLIGSYIRLYPKKVFIDKKINIIICSVNILLCLCSVIFGIIIGQRLNKNLEYFFVNDSIAVITSISIFLLFKDINLKYNKIINMMAESTFGVLLIHANSDTMRAFLWKTLLHNVDIYNYPLYTIMIHFILSVLGIFIICVLIDQLRIRLLEKKLYLNL